MRESANYKFNLPDKADQFNLDHWNQNTEKLDEKLKSIDDLTNDDLKISLLNFIYPVGSLYWSSKSTNPATLFGGTWKQIKDCFILAAGDTYSNGATGGNANTTLTVDTLPSHTHSFTPNGSVKVTTNPTFTGVTVTTGEMSQNASGYTGIGDRNGNGSRRATGPFSYRHYVHGDNRQYAPSSDTHNDCLYMDISHTHSVTAKGSISGGAYTFSGTAGTTGATGSGTAFSNMPPYVAKYCWERTA